MASKYKLMRRSCIQLYVVCANDPCMHAYQAFVNAWNKACSSIGAVNLLVPEGKTYFLKSIRLNGPCKSIITVQVKYIVDYLYYI